MLVENLDELIIFKERTYYGLLFSNGGGGVSVYISHIRKLA